MFRSQELSVASARKEQVIHLLGILSVAFLFCTGLSYYFSSGTVTDREYGSIRSIQFTYSFSVKNIIPGADELTIWVPLPSSDSRQNISNLEVKCRYPYSVQREREYGNSILKIAAGEKLPAELPVSLNFLVTRSAYHALKQKSREPETLSREARQRYLAPDRLIPTNGKIAAEAKKIVRDDMSTLQKARAIYDYVASTMKYDKSGAGWGRGDAVYACDVRRGNCTDFHSLFIGMARASGIPARFAIGFPIPEGIRQGVISGYHCWAEFYIDGLGWIPVDASEANKHREKWDFFFGGLDENRVLFSVGRDIRLEQVTDADPVNYFIYPIVRVDGKLHDNIDWKLSFTELPRR